MPLHICGSTMHSSRYRPNEPLLYAGKGGGAFERGYERNRKEKSLGRKENKNGNVTEAAQNCRHRSGRGGNDLCRFIPVWIPEHLDTACGTWLQLAVSAFSDYYVQAEREIACTITNGFSNAIGYGAETLCSICGNQQGSARMVWRKYASLQHNRLGRCGSHSVGLAVCNTGLGVMMHSVAFEQRDMKG